MTRGVVLVLAGLVAGCALPDAGAALTSGPRSLHPGAPTGLLVLPERGLQIVVPPRDLGPGEEIAECYFKGIDNADALDVVEIETAAALALHHFNPKTSVPQ